MDVLFTQLGTYCRTQKEYAVSTYVQTGPESIENGFATLKDDKRGHDIDDTCDTLMIVWAR